MKMGDAGLAAAGDQDAALAAEVAAGLVVEPKTTYRALLMQQVEVAVPGQW